jgi:predicted transcriptional regulator
MTAGRIQLFYAIANQKPDSMYQLAQLLGRDHPNVIRDVKVLEGVGLVKLVSEKDGERERSRPVALYDRLIFDFGKAGISGIGPQRKTATS